MKLSSSVDYFSKLNLLIYMKLYFVVFQGMENILPEHVYWKELCKILLEIMNLSQDSVPFREPVNILRVAVYLQVIDFPMDLQTVREKLEANKYATPNEFAKDVRLIFENSKKLYPNTKYKIYGQTDRLSFLFEEHFHNILASYETRKTKDGCKCKLNCLTDLVNLQFYFF